MTRLHTTIIPPRPKLIFTEDRTVQLLGIELMLTPGEYTLLRLIYDSGPQPVAADDAGLTHTTMAATVCNINKKAAIISGRKLIVTYRGRGYKLTEHP